MSNAQRAAFDGLRSLDNQLLAELETVGRTRDMLTQFRNTLFEALGWVEEQCFQLKVLQIKVKREEANLLRIEIKERLPLMLFCDPEPAIEFGLPEGPALTGRLYVLLAPPVPGLLRQYSVGSSGAWRRTTFARDRAGQQTTKAVAVPSFSSEMLVREAVDLLQFATTLRFSWPDHAQHAAALTLDAVRDRTHNRDAAVSVAS